MSAPVMVREIPCKRGVLKAFRNYLNAKYPQTRESDGLDMRHRNNEYHQESRDYGDYLYFQDRDMFEVLLYEAMTGAVVDQRRWGGTCEVRHPGWDADAWKAQPLTTAT